MRIALEKRANATHYQRQPQQSRRALLHVSITPLHASEKHLFSASYAPAAPARTPEAPFPAPKSCKCVTNSSSANH